MNAARTLDTQGFLELLAREAPETNALLEEHLGDYGAPLLHLLMADLLRFTVSTFTAGDLHNTRAVLTVVERAFSIGDAYLENAVAVSFVESFGANDGETDDLLAEWPSTLHEELTRQRKT